MARSGIESDSSKLLTLPKNIGRKVVEIGATIACPLLGTDRFVSFCRERGLSIDRERLIRLERLGLFAPVFRVRTPEKEASPFYIPLREGNNWFSKNWARDTTAVPVSYEVPNYLDRSQEGYYSIFQIDFLHIVINEMTLSVHLDSYLDNGNQNSIDWSEKGKNWMEYATQIMESSRVHEYRRSVAMLCQYISNRYYPQTQGDKRIIRTGGTSYSDPWICILGHIWQWNNEISEWDPHNVERLFNLTPEKLRHAYETLAGAQAFSDPLENWYKLIQFVSLDRRKKLKDNALRAETLRSGALMLRLLYHELYGKELPEPDEVYRTIFLHCPELEVRNDVRRYLEFVVNDFGLNPQPKLALLVEGQSEEIAVQKIFELYFGANPGIYGIEIIVLGSVDVATGAKREDRFRAIFRLIDYLHHHQTIAFLILDNENHAARLKEESKKAKSIHNDQRYTTRPDYIRIWKIAFEFDNFSCTEIAKALTQLAQGRTCFSSAEINNCKKDKNPGASLEKLYRSKACYGIQKPKLSEILIEMMLSPNTKRKIENRPIIRVLERVRHLAAMNPFPVRQEYWEINQASKYFGKKRN
ncbi:MAG TPA: hypothetical protein VIF37_01605 [Methylobacter sp.]|jgi:hypothetical protein